MDKVFRYKEFLVKVNHEFLYEGEWWVEIEPVEFKSFPIEVKKALLEEA